MSDRWGGPLEYNVRLGERVSALEAHLPAIRAEISKLSDFTEDHFADMQKELEDVKKLVLAQPQTANEHTYTAILIVGGILTVFLVLFIVYWITGGHFL